MSGDLTGICFDFQRYSIHNGPGIRTTVFLKGCPLSCGWCHNPEGLSADPEIDLVADRCIRCGACLAACPQDPAKAPSGMIPQSCLRCGACADACPASARRLVGESLSVARVVERIERDRPFFEETAGGVTFSGGEPLLQSDFLLECLKACKERSLHTVVDTSGFAEEAVVLKVAAWTDLFLYDLKSMDKARHLAQTGAHLPLIVNNLQTLDRSGARIWIRVPLIPGFNDSRQALEQIGRFVASLERTRCIHLLAFHGFARAKRLRRGFMPERSAAPARLALLASEASKLLAAFGLDVHIEGEP